ncbi:hypothetical protein [Cohnella sp.]|uniref:hypothetical protein n=1 Tax=Cohnella sp. TaxID=1883426 RepID=UPI00356144DF
MNSTSLSRSEYIKRLVHKQVADIRLKDLLIEYLLEVENGHFRPQSFVSSFASLTIDQLCWNHMCRAINKDRINANYYRKLYKIVYLNEIIRDEFSDYLRQNTWLFDECKGTSMEYFSPESIPFNLFYVDVKNYKVYFDLQTKSIFLRTIIHEFVLSFNESELKKTALKLFIKHFNNSLGKISESLQLYSDFNNSTFDRQYTYYSSLKHGTSIGRERLINYLCRFYLFLLNKHALFSPGDVLSREFLGRGQFHLSYDRGYRSVYLNPHDKIPFFDRWILIFNGEEEFTTALRKSQTYAIDFSEINNPNFRYMAKHFIWFGSNNINTRIKIYQVIRWFLNWIDINGNLKSFNSKQFYFSTSVIALYRMNIYSEYSNQETRNTITDAVKTFLKHIQEFDLSKVENAAFDYLRRKKIKVSGGNPITKEDLELLVTEYKRQSREGTILEKLNWIIVNICLTTNLRISEVLDMRTSALEDGPNTAEKILMTKRKGSGNHTEDYYINLYTVRLIEKAFQVTEEIRVNAQPDIRGFLFLHTSKKNEIKVITRDLVGRRFIKMIRSLPFAGGPYKLYNLRDTFMNFIYEEGKKEGKSIFEIHLGTGHRDLRTTLQHYRQPNYKDYLEALHKVIIGDVNILGQIVDSPKSAMVEMADNLNERKVKDECGYCSFNTCIKEKDSECLVCQSFVTTVDRIPYFERSIEKLDLSISECKEDDEKEELLSLKKIYVAYLCKMYEFKERLEKKLG